MAADQIIVEYKAVPTGFDKVGAAVNTVTNETKELQTQIKATFADKSIEAATKKLYEQGDVMGALINKYGNATSALKAMDKELGTMAALGQRGTAQFKELAAATAELKDTIGDTRGEIKKMASDTRVFDTMVQGARGVAAAFSIATGVAAAFGDENKDLQKALLKVQGAMAALQGVQELANIATEKGGIATKIATAAQAAYGFVVGESTGALKLFRIALAATGIGIAILALTELVIHWDEVTAAVRRYLDLQPALKVFSKEEVDAKIAQVKSIKKAYDDEIELKKAAGEDTNKLERQRIKDLLGFAEAIGKDLKSNQQFYEYMSELRHELAVKNLTLEKAAQDKSLKQQQDFFKKQREIESGKKVDDVTPFSLPDAPPKDKVKEFLKGTQDAFDAEKKPVLKIDLKLQPLSAEDETVNNAMKANKAFFDKYTQEVTKTVAAVSHLTSAIFANETQQLEEKAKKQNSILDEQKNAQLLAAGDNAQKKQAIEERFAKKKADLDKKLAIDKAKIERQQAIANKAFAIFNIVLSTAQAIMKAIETYNYAGAAFAGVIGAVEIAAVAAQPLPQIPKFEKGGAVVLAGGRNDDGHLFGRSHRDGGMLINAQGGEYIWDIPTVKKHGDLIKAAHENRLEDLVLHKYVAPLMRATAPKRSSDDEFDYDDRVLRNTIKETSKQSAKYIVNGISQKLDESARNNQRYH